MQNLLHLTTLLPQQHEDNSGGISPTSVANPFVENGNEFLDTITADLMEHDSFTWDDERDMDCDDEVAIGIDGMIDDKDDDGDGEDMENNSDGLSNMMGQLSISDILEDFERNIDWGGYNYNHEIGGDGSEGRM